MFWILLTVIGSILSGIQLKKYFTKDKDGEKLIDTEDFSSSGTIYITVMIVSIIIVTVQGINSITDYPYLAKQLAHIETLKNKTKDIRNSSYTYGKNGNFVAGSIENYQQSTNLSKYIAELAIKEAKYNEYLQEAKIYKSTFILYFFGDGWAISNKINTLPIIK